jgi:diguanylate cyclase (GGDEF)-like protein
MQGSDAGMGHVFHAGVATKKCSERSKPGNHTTRAAILRIDACKPNRTPVVLARRKQKSVKETREAMLLSMADANEELAALIREVNKLRPTTREKKTGQGQDHELLTRAIQCAAKQYMLQTELKNLVLVDELTSLYNRRGFHALADRQLKIASRAGRGLLLFFVDLDGLKQINDWCGHAEGDHALQRTARILKKTFRDSDIVARLGGDEFAVLAVEASSRSEARITVRLRRYLREANEGEQCSSLSLSVGIAKFVPSNPISLSELMAQADKAMYLQKFSRSQSVVPERAFRHAPAVVN